MDSRGNVRYDQRIADFEIGLGDELFIIGLFTRFFGRTNSLLSFVLATSQ